jgi:uncharacterized protein YkwD
MSTEISSMSRRFFLQSAASCLGVSVFDLDFTVLLQSDTQYLVKTFDEIRANLLQLVNEERAVEKVPPLAVDELATRIATEHAHDMATGNFASHWGRDGLKPYQRYSLAGGIDATQENVSAADNTWSGKTKDLMQDTAYLHIRLYGEKPPDDGHRRTILASQHTHVGFGLALDQLRLRLVEVFVARYVELTTVRREAKAGDTFIFAGKLLDASHVLKQVEVFYEPLPKAAESSWLAVSQPYSLPDDSVVLLPKLPLGLTYGDRTTGVLEGGSDGKFTVPVTLFRRTPGIYTIVCWIKRKRSEKAFPATEVCIRVV